MNLNHNTYCFIVIIAVLSLAQSLMASPIPHNSSVLILGKNASTYEVAFEKVYNADNTVPSTNISVASLDIADHVYGFNGLIESFYDDRTDATDSNTLLTELANGYDYVVIIPYEKNVRDLPELTMEGTRLVGKYAQKQDSEVILSMVWDSTDAVSNTETMVEHTYRIADSLGFECLPVGLVWDACLQDSSLSISESAPGTPSAEASYVFATTLFAHLFETNAHTSTYNLPELNATDEDSVIDHAYNTWLAALTNTHYSGDYEGGFCRVFGIPHVYNGSRNFASVGTSTENGVRGQLNQILNNSPGESKNGSTRVNGYNYTGEYFPEILYDPAAQQVFIDKDFAFAFGRGGNADYTDEMATLHTYDPGADAKFIAFSKHAGDVVSTINRIQLGMYFCVSAGRTHPDAYGIPSTAGIGRAWQQRPDLTLDPPNDQHMTDLGHLLFASMVYTVTTGKNPADGNGWTSDELYILNLGYKMVVDMGSLTNLTLPPIAYDGSATCYKNGKVEVRFEGIDLDELPLSVNVTDPANGTVTGTGPNRIYTPDPDFSGTSIISFTLDNGSASSTGEVTVTVLNEEAPPLLCERGRVESTSGWSSVSLDNIYSNMVVVASPVYDSSSVPVVSRIQNATSNRFEILAQAADGSDAAVAGVGLEYFVVEAGYYDMLNYGVQMEAQTYNSTVTSSKSSWPGRTQTYLQSYDAPVVIGQVMTYNDSRFSYFWCQGGTRSDPPSSSALSIGKSVGQDSDDSRTNETLGYIVVEAGSGLLPGDIHFKAVRGGATVEGMDDAPPYTYNYSEFTYPAGAIVSQAGMSGADGSWAVLYGSNVVSETNITLAVDEDTIGDTERSHAAEQVHYLLFSGSTNVANYLPGLPDEDIDGNGVKDLIQFIIGDDFPASSTNEPFTVEVQQGTSGTVDLDVDLYRRENLDFFGLAQNLWFSLDLQTWYNLESSDAATHGIGVSSSTVGTFETTAEPGGLVEHVRYNISSSSTNKQVFFKATVED